VDKLKDKKILSVTVVLVAVVLMGGGLFFFLNNSSSDSDSASDEFIDASNLPELSPEDIGMVVTVREDNQALMFELTKADDIEHVEYTIEYEAQTEEGIANQGIFGEMNIGKDGITETDFREFGTCSAGKCRYDDVVSDITINLKVTKKDGKEYQVQKIVKLETTEEE
jgi:hypothetical protein